MSFLVVFFSLFSALKDPIRRERLSFVGADDGQPNLGYERIAFLNMVETAFPRGGRGDGGKSETDVTKTHQKKRKDDVLFGNSGSVLAKKSKDKRATKKQKQDDNFSEGHSMLPIGGGGCIRSKTGNRIDALGFQKIQPGLKALAICRQVEEDIAIFSLPNLWTAYMMRLPNEPPLTVSLQPNQVISVVVVKSVQESTKEGPRRRIQVSCRPDSVNPMDYNVKELILRGTVRSVEDHGILVDLGMNRTGFLAFDDIEKVYTTKVDDKLPDNSVAHLHVGRIFDFVVKEATDSKVVPLRISKFMEKVTLPAGHKPQIQDLLPGTLIKSVALEATMINGLAVLFGGSTFRGAIEFNHLGAFWAPESSRDDCRWKKFFQNNPSFTARILAVDPKSKIIRLTMLPHLLQLKAPDCDTLPKAGDVVENCTVIKLDPGVGALLAYPDPVDEDLPFRPIDENDKAYMEAIRTRAVYVHISKSVEGDNSDHVSQEAFSKRFAQSSNHTVRILNTNNIIDGVASGATASRIVNAVVMNFADAVPGKLYKQLPIVAKLKRGSVLADFGNGVRGLIPPSQMFDEDVQASSMREKVREAKFAVGAKIDVRVLTLDVQENRILLTAKKSLVQAASEEVASAYREIKKGQIVIGFVSKVDSGGLFVTLFNKVYGRVTASSLTTELGIESPEECYRRGDVLRCRVVYVKQLNQTGSKTGGNEMEIDNRDSIESRYELRLSLQLENIAPQIEIKSEEEDSLVSLQVRKILPAKSMRVVGMFPSRQAVKANGPGYAIVAIKAKHLFNVNMDNVPEVIECKLPFDQILDRYDDKCGENLELFDEAAEKILTKGQKIKRKGMILIDPKKSVQDFRNAVGDRVVVTIKPDIVDAVENASEDLDDSDVIFPGPGCHLFEGCMVVGQVVKIDQRAGSFIKFSENWNGLFPKSKGGLLLRKYNTIKAKVLGVDHTFSPPKILLGPESYELSSKKVSRSPASYELSSNSVSLARVVGIDFNWLSVVFKEGTEDVMARVHCTQFAPEKEPELPPGGCYTKVISSCHPFWGISKGEEVGNFKVTRVTSGAMELASAAYATTGQVSFAVGDKVSGIVVDTNKHNGLVLRISPSCVGFVPWLELSDDPIVLHNATAHFPIGSRLQCVINKTPKQQGHRSKLRDGLQFSVLRAKDEQDGRRNPSPGDLVVGIIDRSSSHMIQPPELILKLRGGKIGRCCITELEEMDEWMNFPLGLQRDDPINESLLSRYENWPFSDGTLDT